MLTKKQISELPKGEYTNLQLNSMFNNHGKNNRKTLIPVDKHGNITEMLSRSFVGHKEVLLNRAKSRY